MEAGVNISLQTAAITPDSRSPVDKHVTTKRLLIDDYFSTNEHKGENDPNISTAANPHKVQKTQLESGRWSCKHGK